jgi:hypothetical protein
LTRALAASFLTMTALVGVALAIALAVGVPHPVVIERAAAAAFGLLGLGAGSIALSAAVESYQPARRPPKSETEPVDSSVASFVALERSLRFGVSTAGDFYAHVRPRLMTITSARLAERGVALSDKERALDLLGADCYALVDPAADPPADRFEPGVALSRVRQLVGVLEMLGGQR